MGEEVNRAVAGDGQTAEGKGSAAVEAAEPFLVDKLAPQLESGAARIVLALK